MARSSVGALRAAARNPHDRHLTDLVGELATRSDAFRSWWAAHDVSVHRTGAKRLRHPEVEEMELTF